MSTIPEDILRRTISARPGAALPAECNRYILYVSHSCPFAHRVIIARQILGLQECIDMIELAPTLPGSGIGWHFDKTYVDTLNDWETLKQAYDETFECDYDGNVSEPLLWDKATRAIVSNESLDMMRMFIDAFEAFCDERAPQLRPKANLSEIEAFTEHVSDDLSNLVYSAHFCEDSVEKNSQMDRVFCTMDELEQRLVNHRFLHGNEFTESDMVLFPTLTRFESVYEPLFHVDRKPLDMYPRLIAYMQDIAHTFQLQNTVRFSINIESYYYSPVLNPEGISPPTRITPVL
jgi:putative glutathione S-transferase